MSSQRAVSRILVPPSLTLTASRPLGRAMADDNHSSRPGITDGLQRPTRRLRTGRPLSPAYTTSTGGLAPPYLALLRAGFCLPSALQQTRCALTAPFHPYPPSPSALRAPGFGAASSLHRLRSLPRRSSRLEEPRAKAGGIFSVPLSFGLPRPGVTRRTALRSSDFPPASAPAWRGNPERPAGRSAKREGRRSSGPLRQRIRLSKNRVRPGPKALCPSRRPLLYPSESCLIAYARASCRDCCAAYR